MADATAVPQCSECGQVGPAGFAGLCAGCFIAMGQLTTAVTARSDERARRVTQLVGQMMHSGHLLPRNGLARGMLLAAMRGERDTYTARYGDNFRLERLSAGMTRSEVAKALGCSPADIAEVECDERPMSAAQERRAAKLFGVSLATLRYPP